MEYGDNAKDWLDKADAINQVSSLGHDDLYIDFLNQNFIRRRYYWQSNESESVVMDREVNFGDLSIFTSPDKRMVVSDLAFRATETRLGTGIIGEMSVNSQDFTISGIEDELRLKNDSYPDVSINIDLKDLNSLLINLVSVYLSDGKGSVKIMLDEYEAAETEVQKFIAMVGHMGNVNGQSSIATWSIIEDHSAAFVARLTEIEDTECSTLNHTIQTAHSTELFALENGFDITQTNNPDNTRTDEEISYAGLTEEKNLEKFVRAALMRSNVEGRPGFDYRHSSGHGQLEARKYAQDCQEFLKLLARLRSKQP